MRALQIVLICLTELWRFRLHAVLLLAHFWEVWRGRRVAGASLVVVIAATAAAVTVLPSFSRNLGWRFTVPRTVEQIGQILTELGQKGTSRGDRVGYEDDDDWGIVLWYTGETTRAARYAQLDACRSA